MLYVKEIAYRFYYVLILFSQHFLVIFFCSQTMFFMLVTNISCFGLFLNASAIIENLIFTKFFEAMYASIFFACVLTAPVFLITVLLHSFGFLKPLLKRKLVYQLNREKSSLLILTFISNTTFVFIIFPFFLSVVFVRYLPILIFEPCNELNGFPFTYFFFNCALYYNFFLLIMKCVSSNCSLRAITTYAILAIQKLFFWLLIHFFYLKLKKKMLLLVWHNFKRCKNTKRKN